MSVVAGGFQIKLELCALQLHFLVTTDGSQGPLIHPSMCLVEKAVAAHSSALALTMPWTEEPGGLQSMRFLGVGHD